MTRAEMELAGEYVLGLLEGAALADFERAMALNPDLSAAVARLRQQMQVLDDSAIPVPPRAGLWDAIESQLDKPEPDEDVIVPFKPKPPLSTQSWMAMAASVVVALGIGYGVGSLDRQAQPVMIAVLIDEGTMQPGAIVEAFADDSIRLQPLELFDVPEGKILQVWTLPDVETGPVSLGTFSDTRTIRLSGPNLPQPNSGQLYEITLEPAPGSPTGRPTGPILVKGFAKAPHI